MVTERARGNKPGVRHSGLGWAGWGRRPEGGPSGKQRLQLLHSVWSSLLSLSP